MEHLTRELLERETIEAAMIQKILDQYKTGLQIMPGTYVEPVAPAADAEHRDTSSHGEAAQSG
jgi:hypothetical protein